MQSHDDNQHLSEGMAQLFARAERMTEQGFNKITAGAPGESPIREWQKGKMTVRQMPNDRACIRVSLGEVLIGEGEERYFVFRGDKDKVRFLLQAALDALRAA